MVSRRAFSMCLPLSFAARREGISRRRGVLSNTLFLMLSCASAHALELPARNFRVAPCLTRRATSAVAVALLTPAAAFADELEYPDCFYPTVLQGKCLFQ